MLNIPKTFIVPPPAAAFDLAMKDGAVIRLRRHGNGGKPRLVFSHGNGLAINAYAPFWLPLADRFDVVVFDMRNHGENPLHDPSAHHWESFFSDFEEIFRGIEQHFGPAPTIGAFHSLSAIAALEHASRQKDRWTALALFDPPIMPRDGHALQPLEHASMTEHAARALRRTDVYDSPDELAAQFRRRRSFKRWIPEAPLLVAQHTLRPTPDGRWTLCCPPPIEARIFSENLDATLWPRMRQLGIPTMLIGGDPQSPDASPAALASRAIHEELGIEYAIEYAYVPDTTHFLQLEEPQACRDVLLAFLQRHALI